MTVAQLVHPVRSLTWPQYGIPFRSLRRALFGTRSCNAIMWREIATGLGFALVGLLMLAVALGAAGAAAPAPERPCGRPGHPPGRAEPPFPDLSEPGRSPDRGHAGALIRRRLRRVRRPATTVAARQ